MAIGVITGATIADLQVHASTTDSYDIVHHTGTLYIVVYSNASGHLSVSSIDVPDDGSSIDIIDTWGYHSGSSGGVALVKAGAGLFATIGPFGSHTGVLTFRVDNSGGITTVPEDTLQIDLGLPYWPSAISIGNTGYHVVTYGAATINEAMTRCIYIDPSTGVITDVDSTTAGVDTYGRNSALTLLSDNMLVIVTNDNTQAGHIRTMTVDRSTGALSAILDDDDTITGANIFWATAIVPVYKDGGMVVFSYFGSGNDGYLHTANIDTTTGAITLLSNLEFNTSFAANIALRQIDYYGNILIGYNGYSAGNPTTEGILASFLIDPTGVILARDSWLMGADEWANTHETGAKLLSIGPARSNILIMFRGRTANGYGTLSTITVQADLKPTPSVGLYAPVDAIPALTSGRNGSGFVIGNEPKFTLDNDPDTYWQSDVYTTSSLYYDLGTPTNVEAVSLWLHNYNDRYADEKTWSVSVSTDNITYATVVNFRFSGRVSDSPVIVGKLPVPVTFRYWRIDFLSFNQEPESVYPQISCVWFMDDYSLPWKQQYGEQNTILHHNNRSTTRAGNVYVSPAGMGKQRVLDHQFTFNSDANQWANLKDAYNASRGGGLPVVMQTEGDSNEYRAVRFDKPLDENQIRYQSWQPRVRLRELGFKRVSYLDKSLLPPHPNSASYHFRGNANDSGYYLRHFTETGSPTYHSDGISEHGETVIDLSTTNNLSILAASADWADMGTDDFTIECWFRGVNGIICCAKSAGDFGLGTDTGWFLGVSGWALRLSISDGVTAGNITGSTTVAGTDADDTDSSVWHYGVMTVDRTADVMTAYIDGGALAGGETTTVDISAVTGSLTDATEDLRCSSNNYTQELIDELTISPGYLMSAEDVAARYAGRANYGSWGM